VTRAGAREAAFVAALLSVLAFAASLRFPDLGIKPLHSDESVNGWFTLKLFFWGRYEYQPADYHGPLLYFVNLVAALLLGPSDESLRLGTAVTGSLTALCLLPARRFLGRSGLLVAGLLLAASPPHVYFSRTCIHEVYLIAATILWAACLVRYAAAPDDRFARWSSVAAALAFATKETALLTAASLAGGGLLAWSLGRRQPGDTREGAPDPFGGRRRNDAVHDWFLAHPRRFATGLALFFGIVVALFTSFGTYLYGVGAFFQAFLPWYEHGVTGRNQGKPFPYFAELLEETMGPLLLVAAAAAALAMVRRHRTGLLLLGWAAASFLLYSLIPYKTPWCALNIELPLFLLIGWASGECVLAALHPAVHPALRALSLPVAAVPLLFVPQMVETARLDAADRYDDDAIEYVYVQTQRGFYDLLRDAFGVADAAGAEHGVRVLNVDAKNPWRWYAVTRGWDHATQRYVREAPKREDLDDIDIVMSTGKPSHDVDKVMRAEAPDWHREEYPLRPGHRMRVWYRPGRWAAYQAAGGRERTPWPRGAVSRDRIVRPPAPKE
jgi:uncharacterized protein (TIGR03663 family)